MNKRFDIEWTIKGETWGDKYYNVDSFLEIIKDIKDYYNLPFDKEHYESLFETMEVGDIVKDEYITIKAEEY